MIKINYQRIGEEHLDKIRKILGVEKGYTTTSIEEARKLADAHYREVADMLNAAGIPVNLSEAEQVIGRMLLGLKQYAQVMSDFDNPEEKTIDFGMLGDEPVDDESGTVLTHEMGHTQDALARGADSYQKNPVLGEFVAVYYAWYTTKDKKIFEEHLKAVEQRYNNIAQSYREKGKGPPAHFQGMTLAEMKAKAMKIAQKDLGAATPEQRAMKRQGKRRRNGGSHNTIQGVR